MMAYQWQANGIAIVALATSMINNAHAMTILKSSSTYASPSSSVVNVNSNTRENELSLSSLDDNYNNEDDNHWSIQATSTGNNDPNTAWSQAQVLTLIGLLAGGAVLFGVMYWLWKRCQVPSTEAAPLVGGGGAGAAEVSPTMASSPPAPSFIALTSIVTSPPPQTMSSATSSTSVSSSPPSAVMMTPVKAPPAVPVEGKNTSDVVVLVTINGNANGNGDATITTNIDVVKSKTTSTVANGEDGAANGGGCGCGCDRGPCTCGDVCVSEAAMPPRYNADGSLDTSTNTANDKSNNSSNNNNSDVKLTAITMVPSSGTFVDAGEHKGELPSIEVTAAPPKRNSDNSVTTSSRAQMAWNVSNANLDASAMEKLIFCRC